MRMHWFIIAALLWPVPAFAQLSDVPEPRESDGRDQRQENRALRERARNASQDAGYNTRQEQRRVQQDRQETERRNREGSLDRRPDANSSQPAARPQRARPSPAMRPR